MNSTLKLLNSSIEKLLYWLTAISAFLFFLMVIGGVGSRHIFHTPIAWSIEISRLLFIWSCFTAAALAYRRKSHIAIGFLTDKLPEKAQLVLEVARQVMTIVFMALVLFAAKETLEILWFSALPVLKISQGWFYVPVTITALSIIFFALEDLLGVSSKIKAV